MESASTGGKPPGRMVAREPRMAMAGVTGRESNRLRASHAWGRARLIAHRALDLAADALSEEGSGGKAPGNYGENRSAGKTSDRV